MKINAKDAEINVQEDLRTSPGDLLYFIERVRLIDGVPSILEKRYIVESYCPGIKKKQLEASVFTLWTDVYKLKIIGADQIFKSIIINKEDSVKLGINKTEAGFMVSATGYIEGNMPLWSEKTLFRGTRYEFRNIIGHIVSKESGTRIFLNI